MFLEPRRSGAERDDERPSESMSSEAEMEADCSSAKMASCGAMDFGSRAADDD